MEIPSQPSIIEAISGDEQVTLSIFAPDPLLTTYVRYRTRITNWSEELEAYSILGSGDVVIDNLTNNTYYELIAYTREATVTSDWSQPVFITPTDGSIVGGPNIHWPRWIFASISKHFNDRKGDYKLYIEGQYRDTKPPKDLFELRMDGPYIVEENKGYFKISVEINILVQSRMDNTNYHRIHEDVGYASNIFTAIKLYKFGNGSMDTQEEFGCLRLKQNTQKRDRLQINHFGQINPKVRLMQASIEGHYEVELTNN